MKRHLLAAAMAVFSILAIAGSADRAAAAGWKGQRAATQDTYCLQGRSYGYPGNCQFSTYEQCRATASGTDSGCGLNPMRAFAYQRGASRDRSW